MIYTDRSTRFIVPIEFFYRDTTLMSGESVVITPVSFETLIVLHNLALLPYECQEVFWLNVDNGVTSSLKTSSSHRPSSFFLSASSTTVQFPTQKREQSFQPRTRVSMRAVSPYYFLDNFLMILYTACFDIPSN